MPKTATASADSLFRAFSDRTRLRILHLLLAGEMCVCDIVAILDVPQPTASRHLATLRRAGLVVVRKDGLWCYYRLAKPHSELHSNLVACMKSCFEHVPELASDAARAKKLRKSSGCCDT